MSSKYVYLYTGQEDGLDRPPCSTPSQLTPTTRFRTQTVTLLQLCLNRVSFCL